MTCSLKSLYLTAFKWGTHVYQYNTHSLSFECNQVWKTPLTCTKDESIDHLIHNNNEIGMIIQNRINNNKYLKLKFDQTFECIWSLELNQCEMTVDRNRFCSIRHNEWLIIDSKHSQLLYISRNGLFKQIIRYQSNQPLYALQIKPNFLLITTNLSVNLHQLV